jgi:hypothetical protein
MLTILLAQDLHGLIAVLSGPWFCRVLSLSKWPTPAAGGSFAGGFGMARALLARFVMTTSGPGPLIISTRML